MNMKNIDISAAFLFLCPLNLSFKLNFNILKVAFSIYKPSRKNQLLSTLEITYSFSTKNLDISTK